MTHPIHILPQLEGNINSVMISKLHDIFGFTLFHNIHHWIRFPMDNITPASLIVNKLTFDIKDNKLKYLHKATLKALKK